MHDKRRRDLERAARTLKARLLRDPSDFRATTGGRAALLDMRFKRAPVQILGSKLFTRREVNARLAVDRVMDRGDFLARLWTLFGPPVPRHGGFEYHVRDRDTNLDFIAYAGRHGATYGGDPAQRPELLRVLEAFDELLEQTPPADCAIEYVSLLGNGDAKWVLGCRTGRSFDVPDRRVRTRAVQSDRRARAR